MRSRRLLAVAFAFGALALPRAAAAQTAEVEDATAKPDTNTEDPSDPPAKPTSFESLEAEDEAPEPKKKKKRKGHRLEFKGRIIARAQLTTRRLDIVGSDLTAREQTRKSLDLTVPSARVGFHYRTHIPGVSAAASLELADKPKLKDAYLQAKHGALGLRVGQFKLPGSPFETANRLALPSAGRGFIHDILTDRLEIGGRRPGLAGFGELELKKDAALELTLGAFQGSYLEDEATRDRALLSMRALGAQTVVARVEGALGVAQLGVTGNYRVGTSQLLQAEDEPEHFWSGGVDGAIDAWLGFGGLRLWADVNVGESWFVAAKRSSTGKPLYTAVRAMAAFRGGGRERGQLYVEPYVLLGGLDPDAKVSHDLATEAAAGVGVGFWQRGHVTVQGGLTRTQRNFSESFVLPDYRDQKTLLLQVGAQL